jgi:hypothetical protein
LFFAKTAYLGVNHEKLIARISERENTSLTLIQVMGECIEAKSNIFGFLLENRRFVG